MIKIKNKEKIKKKSKYFVNCLRGLFIIACILFSIPSISYYCEKGTILNFDRYYQFLLNNSDIAKQTIAYVIILGILTITYFFILKNRKIIFKNMKEILIFIAIVSIIFIAVIPFTSSDVFYYLGIGRLDGTYEQNPYYTTIKEFVEKDNHSEYLQEDAVLNQGYINFWSDTTVVYGPVWTFVCKIVATMSLGNIDIGLSLFKIINALVHIANCYLIYKITHKKLFVLLYGLNPFILIEGIACVHNDMFIILFTLLSLYFLVKKKNILASVIFLAIATAIKYFTILLLPFIIIYYFRNEKPSKRFIRCIQYGVVFFIFICLFYLIYIQDIAVFNGLIVQRERIAKGIYVILAEYFVEVVNTIKTMTLAIFVIIYFFTCVTILNKKEFKFGKEIRKGNLFIMIFLFLLITNFQPWYIMWLFPCLFWQKSDMIKLIIGLSILSQFANSIFLLYEENWHYGTPFIFVLVVGSLMVVLINQEMRKSRIKNAYIRRRKIG